MFKIRTTTFDDFIINWHNPQTHVKNHIFILVTEGSLHYLLNGKHRYVQKGEWLYICPGTVREAFNDTKPHQKYVVFFDSDQTWGLSLLQNQVITGAQSNAFEFMRERFVSLRQHLLNQEPYYDAICNGILLEMLGTACRDLEQKDLPLRKMRQVKLIERYIQTHYRKRVTLPELAALINRSPNYTLTLFKTITGMTPNQYQHRIRITSAVEMLHGTRMSIADIAEHLGYYDASSFYKMFRKLTGKSPSSHARQ